MKIIHTADIHLDSPLCGVKDGKQRRREILGAFSDTVECARNFGAKAFIIAGDLFDKESVSKDTLESVKEIFSRYDDIKYFVLRGNHGDNSSYDKIKDYNLSNVFFFSDNWTSYTLAGVNITGAELKGGDADIWNSLCLDNFVYNILVLHADLDDDRYGVANKRVLAASNADYVALGHRHGFRAYKFGQTHAVYSGALEPRGFDEGEQTGFVVIDTDKRSCNFVPHSVRKIVKVSVELSGVKSTIEAEKVVEAKLEAVSHRDYLDLTLTGKKSEDVNFAAAIRRFLKEKYFALRLTDEMQGEIIYDEIKTEESLRGAFVRLALKDVPENLREDVIFAGLLALRGEEPDL